MTPHGVLGLIQHWLRLWLTSWWHKILSWTNVDLPSVEFCAIRLKAVTIKMLIKAITTTHSKYAHIKPYPHTQWVSILTLVQVSLTRHGERSVLSPQTFTMACHSARQQGVQMWLLWIKLYRSINKYIPRPIACGGTLLKLPWIKRKL